MRTKVSRDYASHVIVVGNEKGGAGKTTTAMHIIVSLLYDGYTVSSIDIDSRQLSLSHYIRNRQNYIDSTRASLPVPEHFVVKKSMLDSVSEAQIDEQGRLTECLNKAMKNSDFVVIDAPGNDTFLSRFAHSCADTVVTPVNDSFVDVDMLAEVRGDDFEVARHGVYSEMVWEAKIRRAQRDKGEVDWVVLRNRLTNLDAKNKRNVAVALNNFAKRVGCRLAVGFGERVIYRELFLEGLTLLDVVGEKTGANLKLSHVAARQELRGLIDVLQFDKKLLQLQEKIHSGDGVSEGSVAA